MKVASLAIKVCGRICQLNSQTVHRACEKHTVNSYGGQQQRQQFLYASKIKMGKSMNIGPNGTDISASRNLGQPLGVYRNLQRAIRWFEVRATKDIEEPTRVYEILGHAPLYSDAMIIRDKALLTDGVHHVYIVACDVISWRDKDT